MMVRVLLLALATRLPNLPMPTRKLRGKHTNNSGSLPLLSPLHAQVCVEPNQRLSCPFLSRFRRSA